MFLFQWCILRFHVKLLEGVSCIWGLFYPDVIKCHKGLVSSAQFFRNCYEHCNVATPCWHFAVIFFLGGGGCCTVDFGKYILENYHGTQKIEVWKMFFFFYMVIFRFPAVTYTFQGCFYCKKIEVRSFFFRFFPLLTSEPLLFQNYTPED